MQLKNIETYVLIVFCELYVFHTRGAMTACPYQPEPFLAMQSPDTVLRIEDAAADGNPTPTNEQVRQYLVDGPLSHIYPVVQEFRDRQRALANEQTPALPPELTQLLTGQLALLWQAAVKQTDADT